MIKDNSYYRYWVLASAMMLLSGCESEAPTVQEMLINLQGSYPALWQMITAFAYVMGFAFCFRAVYHLKIYGEQRTMMSQSGSLKVPITYLVIGSALIYAPSAFQTLLLSTFGTESPTPLSYMGAFKGWSIDSTKALLGLVQIFGLIAFIRGWFHLARAGEQGGQPGSFGKGLAHIIGGILAINIMGTWDLLKGTFGFGS